MCSGLSACNCSTEIPARAAIEAAPSPANTVRVSPVPSLEASVSSLEGVVSVVVELLDVFFSVRSFPCFFYEWMLHKNHLFQLVYYYRYLMYRRK